MGAGRSSAAGSPSPAGVGVGEAVAAASRVAAGRRIAVGAEVASGVTSGGVSIAPIAVEAGLPSATGRSMPPRLNTNPNEMPGAQHEDEQRGERRARDGGRAPRFPSVDQVVGAPQIPGTVAVRSA